MDTSQRNSLGMRPAGELFLLLLLPVFSLCWAAICAEMPTSYQWFKDEPMHVHTITELLNQRAPLSEVMVVVPHFPPAYYLLAYAAGRITRSTVRLALAFPNLLIYLLTLLMCQRISSFFFGRRAATSVLFAGVYLFPYAISMTTEMTVIAGPTMVILATVRLRRSDALRDFAFLAGALAFCLLSKQTTPLFVATPLAWLVCHRVSRSRMDRRFILTFALALLSGLVAAYLVFYGALDWNWLLGDLKTQSMQTVGMVAATSGWHEHLLYYFRGLFGFFVLPLLAILLIDAASRKLTSVHAWLAASVLLPAAVLSLFENKYFHFLLPVMPIWVILLTSSNQRPPVKKVYRLVRTILLALSLVVLVNQTIRHVADDLIGYKNQTFINREIATFLRVHGHCHDVAAVKGTFTMSVYAYNNYAALSPPNQCRLEESTDYLQGHGPPQLVVAFRLASLFDPDRCWTKAEMPGWLQTDKSPSPTESEFVKSLISDYRPIRNIYLRESSTIIPAESACAVSICERIRAEKP